MNTRVRLLASLTVAGLGLFAPAAHAQTVTFRAVYNETLRGGLTTDGWGGLSSPTTYATGAFHIRLPRGARVVWARLLTDVVMRPQDVMTATVPAGPTGFRREVILGGTNGAVTRSLEGRPDYVRTVSFTYGTFSTDVTDAVQMLVGSVAPGGEVEIPIRERGDEGPSNGSVSQAPVFEGHGLAVVYALDYGPRRNVTVYEGNAAGNVRVTDLPLRSPVANRCPTSSLRGEAFPLSLMLASEYSVCQEDNPLTINGTRVSSTVGGADDWPNDPRTGCNGSIAGLVTVGSFGGGEASEGAAAGAPVGLEGDSVTGPPPAPRLDDELYDARTFLADGVTRMDFNFGGNGDEVVFGIGLQSLARDQMTDADDDGFTDEAEGDCGTDTDRDGTPDYLDLDADNDCLPDRMETASGRIDPAMPGPADANCVGGAPVCDRAVGVCGCRTNSDCPAAAPVCDPRARFCSACTTSGQCAGRVGFTVCATGGAREGQCVECTESGQCAGGRPTGQSRLLGVRGMPSRAERESTRRRVSKASVETFNPGGGGAGGRCERPGRARGAVGGRRARGAHRGGADDHLRPAAGGSRPYASCSTPAASPGGTSSTPWASCRCCEGGARALGPGRRSSGPQQGTEDAREGLTRHVLVAHAEHLDAEGVQRFACGPGRTRADRARRGRRRRSPARGAAKGSRESRRRPSTICSRRNFSPRHRRSRRISHARASEGCRRATGRARRRLPRRVDECAGTRNTNLTPRCRAPPLPDRRGGSIHRQRGRRTAG
jgi:hypothetical protein